MADTITDMFKEMLEVEMGMDSAYLEIISLVEDKKIKNMLEAIRAQEKKHENNVREILKILKE